MKAWVSREVEIRYTKCSASYSFCVCKLASVVRVYVHAILHPWECGPWMQDFVSRNALNTMIYLLHIAVMMYFSGLDNGRP